jgi:hypothetical protein
VHSQSSTLAQSASSSSAYTRPHIEEWGRIEALEQRSRFDLQDAALVGADVPPDVRDGVDQAPASGNRIRQSEHDVVRADGSERIPIRAGQAAFWQPGERHEAGTDVGRTAIVVETEALGGDPMAISPAPPTGD